MALYTKIVAATLLCTVSASLHAAEYWENRPEEFQRVQKAKLKSSQEEEKYKAACKTFLELKREDEHDAAYDAALKSYKMQQALRDYLLTLEVTQSQTPAAEQKYTTVTKKRKTVPQGKQQIQERNAALRTASNITPSSIPHHQAPKNGITWNTNCIKFPRFRSKGKRIESPLSLYSLSLY